MEYENHRSSFVRLIYHCTAPFSLLIVMKHPEVKGTNLSSSSFDCGVKNLLYWRSLCLKDSQL